MDVFLHILSIFSFHQKDMFRQALEKQPMDDGQQKYFLVPIKGESGAKPILALLVRKKQWMTNQCNLYSI